METWERNRIAELEAKAYFEDGLSQADTDELDHLIAQMRQRLPKAVRRLGNQMVVNAGLPETDE